MKVALIGFGTVGQGVYDILKEKQEYIKNITGETIEVKYIKNSGKNLERFKPEIRQLINLDYDDILNEVDVIVEASGAYEEGYEYIRKALENKKHVVTANKAVVSGFFEELSSLAKNNRVNFVYEASVCGGTPVISPLSKVLASNDVYSIYSILNGTCNYLLSKMFDEDISYKDCLKMCQDLGYAEQDPTDDVEGFDTMRKLRILTTMTMGEIQESDIKVEGISKISKEVIDFAKKNKKKIKLVAMSKIIDGDMVAIVEPTMVDRLSPLGSLPDALNIVRVEGNNIGKIAFEGPGAGKLPTGNSIVADLIDIKLDKVYPLIKKERLNVSNDNFKARYLVCGQNLDEDLIEIKDNNVQITKLINRKKLISILDEKTFIARVEY